MVVTAQTITTTKVFNTTKCAMVTIKVQCQHNVFMQAEHQSAHPWI